MKKRLVCISIGIVVLFIVLPIILLVIDVVADIYPKSKDIYLKQPMISTLWEQNSVHKRTCKQAQWFFVAISNYEPAEIIQYYEEKWNRMPEPLHLGRAESEHQGMFFPIFSFTTLKLELSMEKYLGYTTQSIPLKEYTIGNYLYICTLDN